MMKAIRQCARLGALLAVLALPSFANAQAAQATLGNEKFGTVHFPTSCNPVAQRQFEHALAMLHSFYYPNTVSAFKSVLEDDPQCAIAYWGIAMSQRPNPLLTPFDETSLKNGLEASQRGLALGPKTERESDWLRAIELFYKDYRTVSQQQRTLAYEQAMAKLSAKYPRDTEAAIFYALALNEAASHSDKTYARQLKAGAILERIYRAQPDHPGVAHYLIHSYDCSALAQRGLPFAEKYASIAPDAPHALHMPSHTYSMLGMWPESVKSNEAALTVMVGDAARAWPGQTHPNAPHSWDFMEYAYLQMGMDRRASSVRDQAEAARKFPFERPALYTALAAIPARYALERGAWQEAAALQPRGSSYAQAEAITYFTRALGAARSGDPQAAQADIEKLRELRANLDKSRQPYWVEQGDAQILAASAWVELDMGRNEQAVSHMRQAAKLEDASEKDVAMENRLYPMRELLGDMLLGLNQPGAALQEYETSLKSTPNRLRGLYGAAKSAQMLHDDAKAASYFKRLVLLTANADATRAEIQEARGYRDNATP
ncbi:tetratricopeptide repeat protein [Cupriavidus basilensis]|uniref:tetratricopeptide repeat protein n=1 Tax=Cupriavidus basilensis TaxID=68895 RepID=UPI0020A6A1A5|nr:hypothetical protein [Cupriavidus basilensis]MCP3021179.1 hypothetical protein [Cupriavidus basilensis]